MAGLGRGAGGPPAGGHPGGRLAEQEQCVGQHGQPQGHQRPGPAQRAGEQRRDQRAHDDPAQRGGQGQPVGAAEHVLVQHPLQARVGEDLHQHRTHAGGRDQPDGDGGPVGHGQQRHGQPHRAERAGEHVPRVTPALHPAGQGRARQRPGPDAGEQVAVAVRAHPERAGDQQQQHGLRAVDGAADDVRAHQPQRTRAGAQRRGAVGHAPQHAGRALPGPGGPEGLARGNGQHRERRQPERDRVQQEGQARRSEQQQDTAESRPGDDGDPVHRRPGGVRAGQVGAVHQARRGRRHARQVGGGGGGRRGGDQRGQQDRRVSDHEQGQQDHQGGPRDIAGDHDAPPVKPVGDHPAQRPQGHDRDHPRGSGDPGPQRRVGPVIHQGDEGQVVQPVAQLGHGQPAEQPAERRVTQ